MTPDNKPKAFQTPPAVQERASRPNREHGNRRNERNSRDFNQNQRSPYHNAAGRHEAGQLAASLVGLISFIAKDARIFAEYSNNPDFTEEQQNKFRKLSKSHSCLVREAISIIEEAVGRKIFEGPYVAEHFNRNEKAMLLETFDKVKLDPKVTQSIYDRLEKAEESLSAPAPAVEASEAQPGFFSKTLKTLGLGSFGK